MPRKMSSFSLSKPQRRKRVYCNRSSPFPVPIATQTNLPPTDEKWYYYTAYLVNGRIFVKHSGDIEQLYTMGFFGKGTLSRHRPHQYHITPSLQWPVGGQNRTLKVKVTSRRKYLRHEAWARHECSDGEEVEKLPIVTKSLPQQSVNQTVDITNSEKEHPVGSDKVPMTTHVSMIDLGEQRSDGDTPEVSNWSKSSLVDKKDYVDSWATSTEYESADFWGLTVAENPQTGKVLGEQLDVIDCVKSTMLVDPMDSTSNHGNPTKPVESLKNVSYTKINPDTSEMNDVFCEQRTEANETLSYTSQTTLQSCKSFDTKPSTCRSDNDQENGRSLINICLSEEEDGELLIVDDTEDSDVDTAMNTRLPWQPVIRREPYQIQEHLQLSMEEAFFLSYGLGCLVLHDEKQVLDLTTMWRIFCDKDANFLPRYVVYHNLRSKGWIPKSGLKYGSDFVVYKQGPAFYHSTYSVMVRRVSEKDLRERREEITREYTWTSLAAINRITEQVSKDLMLCYVIEPDVVKTEHTQSPACVKHFKVQEIVVKRTVSKQERENPQYIVIP